MIGKAIVECTSQVIVCVCFTNHALDQFLEDLIDIGVDRNLIARLGQSPKISAKIESLQLQKIAASQPKSKLHGRVLFQLLNTASDRRVKISDLDQRIKAVNGSATLSWLEAEPYFSTMQPSLLDSFAPSADAGEQIVGKRGKALTGAELWQQWLRGEKLHSHLQSRINDVDAVWSLSKQQRLDQALKWRNAILTPLSSQVRFLFFTSLIFQRE